MVVDFLNELKDRNAALFYFGWVCLVAAFAFLAATRVSHVLVYEVNAWYKPFKFAFSTVLFSWAMAWYIHYLPQFPTATFNGVVILLLGFEIVYIAWQASRGQPSHYNTSTPFFAVMFSLMAVAATVVTLFVAYAGWLFFQHEWPELPGYYVWSIRLGICIFVVFSLEGFAMGSRLSHSVGAVNDNSNLWVLGWSRTVGDLRVAHFIGMHALQVLPLLAYFLLRSTRLTIGLSALYAALAVFTLVQALQGKPLWGSAEGPRGKNRAESEQVGA
jgi:hypothetical protein